MPSDKVVNSKTSRHSSSSREINEFSVNAESSENLSSSMQKNKQDNSAKSKLPKNVEIDLETIGKTSNSFPASLPKDKGDNVNKIKSSKNGTVDIQSSKDKSGSLSALPIVEGDKISLSSSSFGSMVLDARPGNSDNTNSKGPPSQGSYKPEKWMLPQYEDALTQLNLAIVCH